MAFKLLALAAGALSLAIGDPFAPLSPPIHLSTRQRDALDRGEIVAQVIPARRGQIAAFAASRIDAPPEVLVPAARNIADLKRSQFVEAIGRFSDPPRLADLDQLRLSERDLQALASCEVGACSFKLSATEIDTIKRRRYGDRGGEQATAALKEVLLKRAAAYRSAGIAALPPIANRRTAWRLDETLTALHRESPPVLRQPPLDAWLAGHAAPQVESFMYWSQEFYGAGKPVLLLTDIAIYRPSPDAVIVVGKQIFSSRYMNGAISLMTITTDARGAHVLTYLNRTSVDLVSGVFGGFARSLLETEIADTLPEVIAGLRRRLERTSHATSPDSVRHN